MNGYQTITHGRLALMNLLSLMNRGFHLSDSDYSPELVRKYLARSQATINTLDPSTAEKMTNFWMEALQNGILLLMYSGNRDYPEQWDLRKKYLAGGPRAARPGESWHNFGKAVDLVPITPDGKADWNTNLYPKLNTIAKKHGLKWGGSFSDQPHFFYDSNASLYLLRNNKPGWKKYHDLEKGLNVPEKIKKEETEIERDNKLIFKKVALWSLGLGLAGFLGYKTIKSWS